MNLDKVLQEALPARYWEKAEKAAKRSTLNRHRTGAVIFSKNDGVISDGCSHHCENAIHPSTHAEADAISRAYNNIRGASIVIVTLTKGNNYARSSRPCLKCLLHMDKVGLGFIVYAECQNDGEWAVNTETPLEMITRNSYSWVRRGAYAKDMRTGVL